MPCRNSARPSGSGLTCRPGSARWRFWWWPRPGTAATRRASHEPIGREAGLTDPEIEALRVGDDPKFADDTEQVAYSVARALTGPADLDEEEYAAALSALGEEGLVELSTLVGYYAILALQLRIFRVPAP